MELVNKNIINNLGPRTKVENLEKRKNVIEGAKQERLKILGDVYKRVIGYLDSHIPKSIQNLASNVLDFTIVSNFKMGTEAVKGKTMSGEELSIKDRIMYGLAVTTSVAAYGLTAYGLEEKDMETLKLAGEVYVASWIFFIAQKGPQLIKNAQQITEKHKNLAMLNKFFTAFGNILEKYGPENLIKLINKKDNLKNNDNK